MRRAYRGKLLSPIEGAISLRYLEDGLLVVDETGKIEHVGPFDMAVAKAPVRDLRPAVLLPGFVDAHVHYPQTRIIGSATGPLLRWLEATVFPEEARFREEAYARAVAAELTDRLIACGTTTSVVFSSSDPGATRVLFEALSASGLRSIAGLTLMDQACPDELRLSADRAIGACEELCDAFHGFDGGRLSFAVTPRFALSCSRPLLEAAGRFASDRGLWVQTHVAENPSEGVETLAAHPFGRDYLDVYDKVGLLGARTLLAHAIHLSGSEWDRVAERGARIAHCPDSNFFLGSGRMRLDEARARGIPVALGSDVAAGRTFDMRRAIASGYDNALCAGFSATPAELFTMATLGGARAIGLGDVIGSLEPGKDADFVVLRVPSYATTEAQVLAQVAFASEGTRVERAFVRGERVSSLAL